MKLEAGKYYIGDLCYVISDEEWDDFLESTAEKGGEYHSKDDGFFKFKGVKGWAAYTAWGDGCYFDNEGFEYPVDSGAIGIIPVDVIDELDAECSGRVVEKTRQFTPREVDGAFFFGSIRIGTK